MPSVFEAFEALYERDDVAEGEIQTFMENNTELIPTPFMLGHDLQWNSVISKFELERANIPDFAYITKNSAQWRFVFVELERPQKHLFITLPHVEFHSDTRYAIGQIEGWKSFAERNREEIVRRLQPLMRPVDFWQNPVDIHYLLIIGRKRSASFPTTEHSGRIKRLAEESGIHLCTYDAIRRMGPGFGIGSKKNVLRHSGQTFAFKKAEADTGIFANYLPGQIGIDAGQVAWFTARGYDMDSWSKGELLTLNDKMPYSRRNEVFDELFREVGTSSRAVPPPVAAPQPPPAAPIPTPQIPAELFNLVVSNVTVDDIIQGDGQGLAKGETGKK